MPGDIPNTTPLNKFKIPYNAGKSLAIFFGAIILALTLWNSWFTVAPEEVGIILRFGKYVREAPPGLNFKFPNPIEKVIKVPVQRQLKEEFGFRTQKAAVRTLYAQKNYRAESLMLTGDLNVVVVEWSTQFRIKDPFKYLFKVRDMKSTFRDMNEAVMRQVVGNRTVNEVLTTGRRAIAEEVKRSLQTLCNQYETGIAVDQIVLQNVTPPDPVKPSFNEVNQAQQEKEKLINQAMAEYNRIIPRAKGEALKTIQQAKGYATERINQAQGDALWFEALLKAYKEAPEITKARLYLETMDKIYPQLKTKYIVDQEIKGLLPLLNLGKEGK